MLLALQLNLQNQAQVAWLQVSAPVRLVADAGAFALAGVDADLVFGGAANRGQVSWVQVASGGVRLAADAGAFAFTGQDAGLVYVSSTLRALVSWLEVGVRRDLALQADPGAFTLSVAPSLSDFALTADTGAMVFTWRDAQLAYSGGPGGGSYVLAADAGSFVFVGRDAQLVRGGGPASYSLAAFAGGLALVGRPARLLLNGQAPVTPQNDTSFYRRVAQDILAGRVDRGDSNGVIVRIGARRRRSY